MLRGSGWKIEVIQPITKVYELKYKDVRVGIFSSFEKALKGFGEKVLNLGSTDFLSITEIELDKTL